MNNQKSHLRRSVRLTSAVVLCLCICLLTSSLVRAQKTPSIFNTSKDKSTSAMNMTYINTLEGEYNDTSKTKDERKLIRNRLIYIGVEQIDAVFNDYRKQSRKRNDLIQFLFDFLEIGMSTTIAIINGERAKTVIAEVLTGFKGSRTAANKNFHLMERQILFNKMVANRADRLSEIYEKLNGDVVSYPWESARVDLRNYFFAGTFDDAINSLSIDTGAAATTAEENLKGIKERFGIVGPPDPKAVKASSENFDQIRGILEVGFNADNELKVERGKAAAAQDAAKITKLETTRKNVLDDLRVLLDLVQADPKLKAYLAKTPEEGGDAAEKADLAASLARIKENKSPTLDDYDAILLKLNSLVSAAVSKDPGAAESLKTILSSSKTLKSPTN